MTTVRLKNQRKNQFKNRTVKAGFYASLVAFIAALGYSVAQVLQIAGAIKYPLDANLIYGFSLVIATPYLVAVVALHYSLPNKRRIWTHLAMAFAIMYVTYVNLNYVVQLTIVIPASARGTLSDIRILDQTPHSLFWDIDALGYICMGISTFILAFAFPHREKWLRRFLFMNGLMTPVIGFVYFYPNFSIALLLIGSPWIVTTPGALLLLCFYFHSRKK